MAREGAIEMLVALLDSSHELIQRLLVLHHFVIFMTENTNVFQHIILYAIEIFPFTIAIEIF